MTCLAIAQLNNALHEVYTWCQNNQLTPHSGRSEVLLLSTRNLMCPFAPVFLEALILNGSQKHTY